MRRLPILASLVIAVANVCAAQPQQKSADPAWIVPEKAIQRTNPLAGRPDAAVGGGKLFARMCASCHGDATHGQKNNAPDLRAEFVQQETDGALFWRISNGNSRKGMPSFSSLPEAQRWQLVLYLRTLGSAAPVSMK